MTIYFIIGFWGFCYLGVEMIWVDLGLADCSGGGLADLGAKSIDSPIHLQHKSG